MSGGAIWEPGDETPHGAVTDVRRPAADPLPVDPPSVDPPSVDPPRLPTAPPFTPGPPPVPGRRPTAGGWDTPRARPPRTGRRHRGWQVVLATFGAVLALSITDAIRSSHSSDDGSSAPATTAPTGPLVGAPLAGEQHPPEDAEASRAAITTAFSSTFTPSNLMAWASGGPWADTAEGTPAAASALLNAAAGCPAARVSVSEVHFDTHDTARVTYGFTDTPVGTVSNYVGTANRTGGRWRVSEATVRDVTQLAQFGC